MMTLKNIEFCKMLFKRMTATKEPEELWIILDYFSMKTLELLNSDDAKEIAMYHSLFEEFEEILKKSNNELNVFFFALNSIIGTQNIIEDKEYIKLYVENLMEITKDDMINRKV